MSRPRLVVVVAHPDDETFGCGSVLAHAAARGVETTVVCATRGEGGEPAPGSGVAVDELAVVRAAELHAAAALLGVHHVELLDWRDSGMSGEAPEGALVAAPLEDVAGVIGRLLDQLRPDVVVTLDASDGHRDHVHVRDATLLAVGAMADPPRTYLQCLPRQLMARWAERLRAEGTGDAYLEIGRLGTPEADVTTVVDVASLLPVRERAIAAHTSQVPPFDVMPADLREAFLTVDRLQRVVPPWDGGPVEHDLFAPTIARTTAE